MNRDRVAILQTCDGERYKPLLDATEAWHREYCRRWGYDYRRFDGVSYGFKPWHATFNRIFLLQELQEQGKHDWALYLDADAVVVDGGKPLDGFLDDAYALVACRGSTDDPAVYYNINAGVAFFNLRHHRTRHILSAWRHKLESVPEAVMRNEPEGVFDTQDKHVNDQDMLCEVLYAMRGACKVYRGEQHNAFNYHGPFIQQMLRSEDTRMEVRERRLRELVAASTASLTGFGPTRRRLL